MFLWGWLNKQQVDLKKHSGKSLQLTHLEMKGEHIGASPLARTACVLLTPWESREGEDGGSAGGEPGDGERVLKV